MRITTDFQYTENFTTLVFKVLKVHLKIFYFRPQVTSMLPSEILCIIYYYSKSWQIPKSKRYSHHPTIIIPYLAQR